MLSNTFPERPPALFHDSASNKRGDFGNAHAAWRPSLMDRMDAISLPGFIKRN
jgi:hypothetical protein